MFDTSKLVLLQEIQWIEKLCEQRPFSSGLAKNFAKANYQPLSYVNSGGCLPVSSQPEFN